MITNGLGAVWIYELGGWVVSIGELLLIFIPIYVFVYSLVYVFKYVV